MSFDRHYIRNVLRWDSFFWDQNHLINQNRNLAQKNLFASKILTGKLCKQMCRNRWYRWLKIYKVFKAILDICAPYRQQMCSLTLSSMNHKELWRNILLMCFLLNLIKIKSLNEAELCLRCPQLKSGHWRPQLWNGKNVWQHFEPRKKAAKNPEKTNLRQIRNFPSKKFDLLFLHFLVL